MAEISDRRNAGPLVLNVNDNDASRYLVTRMLERSGFTVIEAATGGEALEKVHLRMPRLVVLDIKLPDMDGLEVCRQIKADPRTHGVKVLHTSAVFVATEFKVQSLECGADGYLSHPFEQEELIATVRSLLRLSEVEQELRDQAEELKAANRRTNEFLAMLAHELRNPLAAIVTSLPLLERSTAADPVEKTARELIRRQTTHLRRLVGRSSRRRARDAREDRPALGGDRSQRARPQDRYQRAADQTQPAQPVAARRVAQRGAHGARRSDAHRAGAHQPRRQCVEVQAAQAMSSTSASGSDAASRGRRKRASRCATAASE
ncbi:MAG: response regulator [Gammaproteobacteria bacterium]